MNEPNDLETEHELMLAFSRWLIEGKGSRRKIEFAIKTAWMADYCKTCRTQHPEDWQIRFPSAITEDKKNMVRAGYRCYRCHTSWTCWWGHTMLGELDE